MKTLVIIDAQEFWRNFVDKCIDGIILEIKNAIKNHFGIILVKYKDRGIIHPQIQNALKFYKKKTTTTKKMVNGGNQVIKAARRMRFPLCDLRVCGVFTDCCVAQTVTHLSKTLPMSCIEVINNACWPDNNDCWPDVWYDCKDNVVLA